MNQFVKRVYDNIKSNQTLGEIWSLALRHLATPAIRNKSWASIPTKNFTPTPANGWLVAGWIIVRRSFIGPLTRPTTVFQSC